MAKKATKARLYWIVEKAGGVWWVRPEARTRKVLVRIDPMETWNDIENDPSLHSVAIAVDSACEIARHYWRQYGHPSEIHIRRVSDGQFRDPITIPRSSDPRRSRG